MANEISKLQFLRTNTANKVPTAAQLDEGSLAINMVDQKLFSKDSKGAVYQFGYSQKEIDANLVPKTTRVNNKPLSGNIVLDASDVGALPIVTGFFNGDLNEINSPGLYSPTTAALNIPAPIIGTVEHFNRQGNAGFIQVFHSNGAPTSPYANRHWIRTGSVSNNVTTWTPWVPLTGVCADIGSGNNLNDISVVGNYWGNGWTNGPTALSGAYAIVEVIPTSSAGVILQKFTSSTANRTFQRTLASGRWNEWAENYTSTNKPSLEDLGVAVGDSYALNRIPNGRLLPTAPLNTRPSSNSTVRYIPSADAAVPKPAPEANVGEFRITTNTVAATIRFTGDNLPFPVIPGEKLDYSVFVNSANSSKTGKIAIVLSYINATGSTLVNRRVAFYDDKAGGWQKLYGTDVVPVNSVSCVYQLWVEIGETVGTLVYFASPNVSKREGFSAVGAEAGVNSDIIQMNNLELVRGSKTDFDGSIYQIGGARTFQNNYRIGLIRGASTSGNVNPYITFVQKDVGDGDLLPTTNRVISRIETKTASTDANNDYGGRAIGAYQVWLDPNGNGITQIATYDSNGANTMIDVYSGNGSINLRNRDINGVTSNTGKLFVGGLATPTSGPVNGEPLFAVHNKDIGTGGQYSTYIGHNGGTAEAPIYSHYFRGKGVTRIDTLGGLVTTTGITNTGTLTSTGIISVIGAGASNAELGSGAADIFLRNTTSGKVIQLKDNGELSYSNQKIYYEGFKPTATDVGALPITGGTLTGPLNVSNGNIASLAGNVTTPNLFLAGGAYGSTSGFQLSGGGGPTGVYVGKGDGASYTSQNLDIKSWFGVGFSSSSGTNGTTVVINTRTGDISNKGAISAGGVILSGSEITATNTYRIVAAGNGSNCHLWAYDPNGQTERGVLWWQTDKTANIRANNRTWTFRNDGTFISPGNIEAPNFVQSSDIKIKRDIKVIENALDKIDQVRGVTYEKETNTGRKEDEKAVYVKEAGFIAQEIREVLPEAVFESSNDLLGVSYGSINALLLQAVKELHAKVKELEAK